MLSFGGQGVREYKTVAFSYEVSDGKETIIASSMPLS